MKKAFFAGVLFLLPGVVFGAGFAKQSLFLSKSTVTVGDTVLVHASVSNETATKFTGTLVFSDKGGSVSGGKDLAIGSVPVSLIAGEADTLSVSWKPAAGSHTVEADLQDKNGTVVEHESATFTIAEKPPPPSKTAEGQENFNSASAVDSSAPIQHTIGQISPAVAQSVQPVFAAVDSARSAAADVLDKGIDYEKRQLAKNDKGQILGGEIQRTPVGAKTAGWTNTLWTIIDTVVLYVLSVLRWLVGNAGVFYPALALLFFYFLWRLYKRMRR